MLWEYSPSSANLASEWLRAKSSPVDEEEIKMDDCVDTSLRAQELLKVEVAVLGSRP